MQRDTCRYGTSAGEHLYVAMDRNMLHPADKVRKEHLILNRYTTKLALEAPSFFSATVFFFLEYLSNWCRCRPTISDTKNNKSHRCEQAVSKQGHKLLADCLVCCLIFDPGCNYRHHTDKRASASCHGRECVTVLADSFKKMNKILLKLLTRAPIRSVLDEMERQNLSRLIGCSNSRTT